MAKKAPQSKLLVDTNAYLRLARTIHPLLGAPFCPGDCCAYILPECNQELNRPRLQTRFTWVNEPQYQNNRVRPLTIVAQQRESIEKTFDLTWKFVQKAWYAVHPEFAEERKRPSWEDTRYVATAEVLGLPIVTDDVPMIALADDFAVPTITSVRLLWIMVDCDHTDLGTVEAIRNHLQGEHDWPFSPLERDCQYFFPELCA